MATRIKAALSRPGSIAFALAAAFVLTAPALLTGYQVDDWMQHLKLAGEPSILGDDLAAADMFCFIEGDRHQTRELMRVGFLPWWTLDTLRLSFWRPVTVMTHILDHALWQDSFFMMHLHSLLWYGVAVAMAGVMYRKLLAPAWAAGLAVLLFAISDNHAMPAGWLANRNESIALFWGLLALWSHIKWREEGRNEWLTVALFALGISLLAKESGLAACAYLLAYAVFLDPGRLLTRFLSLLPYAGTVIVWRLAYHMLGHGISGSATYTDPLLSPLAFAQQLFHRAPVLFLGQWGLPPSDIHIVLPSAGQWLLWGAGLLLLALLAVVFAPMFRYDARLRFWALGMGLSLIPICAAFPSDRLLLWPGIGAFGLLAQYLYARSERREMWSHTSFARVAAPLMTAFLVVVHVILAPMLMPVRILAFATLGDAIEESIVTAPLPGDIENRTLVIANTPNVFFSSYFLVVREVLGMPLPARIRTLSANNLLPEPHEITRLDANSVRVRPMNGFRWYLVRDDAHPFAIGDVVDLGDMSVEIIAVNRQGQPLEVIYRFRQPLDDPHFVWLVYKAHRNEYVLFMPPPIGQTFTVDPYT